MGSIKGTTKSQGSKDSFDRFYTDVNEASRLLSILASRMPELFSDPSSVTFLEPSAGAGSFVKACEDAGYDIQAYDLVPSSTPVCETTIAKQDFLDDAFTPVKPQNKKLVAIGNPPFGSNGTLAFQFVAKCMTVCDAVAFIMPPSACKDSAKSKTGDARMRFFVDVLCEDYTVPTGDKIAVPSKFVVYTKITDDDRKADAEKKESDNRNLASIPFEFTSKANAEKAQKEGKTAFSIRRVGGTSGSVRDTLDLSEQSNYFCVMRDDVECSVDDIAAILAEPIPERDLSVGPRSLSRAEIARAIVERMNL